MKLPPTRPITVAETKADFAGALIVAPPSAAGSAWLKRFGEYSDALASGWMQVRGNRRRRGLDRGFVISDHADWPGFWKQSRRPARAACWRPTALSRRCRAICKSAGSTRCRCRPPMARRRKPRREGFRRPLPPARSATSTRAKHGALVEAFARRARRTRPAARPGSFYFLAGGKPRQSAPTRLLRRLAVEESGLPEWLVEESYSNVGDLAETLSLLLPQGERADDLPLDVWMRERLLTLRPLDEEEKYARLAATRARCPPSSGSCFSSSSPANCASACPACRSSRRWRKRPASTRSTWRSA